MPSVTEMLIQFLIGGSVIVAQTYFANQASPFYAGLVYAAPVLMLPAGIFTRSVPNLQKMAITGAFMIGASVVYDTALWYLLRRGVGKAAALVLALVPWLPAAWWLGRVSGHYAREDRVHA